MNGLHLLQAFLGQGDSGRQLGQALQDPENKGFLDTLLQSGAFGETELDAETLQAMLRGELPMELPETGGDLPLMGGSLPQGGTASAQQHADEPLPNTDRQIDDPLAMMAGLGLLNAQTASGAPQDAELAAQTRQGEQLGARLALLDQLELRRQAGAGQDGPDSMAARSFSETSGLQQFQALMPQAGADARPTAVPTFTVGTPMDQSGWGQSLGERVLLLAGQGIKQARIQLNPRELGPVDVAITLREDKTQVVFQAQHAVTREALEAELPRLRTMLQEQGFDQLDVNVGRDGQSELAGRERGEGGGDGRDNPGASDDASDTGTDNNGLVATRLLDHYA